MWQLTRRRITAASLAALGAVVAGCNDSNVPYFTAPTTVPNAPSGIQNAVTGLFAGSRGDVGSYVLASAGFARDGAVFTNADPTTATWPTGEAAISPAFATVWGREYLSIGQAEEIIAAMGATVPAYTPAQIAAGTGVLQTIKALNYMEIAEIHDSLGMPIQPTPTAAGQAYCIKDVWRYIVALLDSANDDLSRAGAVPVPFTLPTGFSAVSVQAAPSTTAGAFAAFNRALAGKAGLELAYAIARSTPATHPTPTTPGAPDIAALTRADSALGASALVNPAALAAPLPGGFVVDPFGVYWDFSAQSGDLANPINQVLGTFAMLKEFVVPADTLHDRRWLAKFGPNPNPVQQPSFNFIASGDEYEYYPAPGSPIPIVRNEELVLVRAQIQLGLGNLSTALTYLNDVRQAVAGLSPVTGSDYVTVRDSLLRDQRISTTLEGSGDRVIALRMYHLEAVADTTWGTKDLHTTVEPIPTAEVSGRNGSYSLACP